MTVGSYADVRRVRRVEHCMGTAFSLDIRGARDTETAVEQVIDWLHWVDATFSTYRPDSPISRLGRGELVLDDCPPEVAEVLALCADVSRVSGRYFTATPNGALDPSGLVKGWAIERASDLLRAAGSTSHVINGGGDVQLAGEPAPGRSWRVGIADPLHPGLLASVVTGADIAVATTGTTERGAHVLDPFTGRPATDLASVTLVGRHLTTVDAYATAAFAMGTAARDWVEQLPGIEAFGITRHGQTWRTRGFLSLVDPAVVGIGASAATEPT